MKKILFPLIALIASATFGQINLIHSFSDSNIEVIVSNVKNSTYYGFIYSDSKKIELYTADFLLYKTINLPANWSARYDVLITDKLFNNDELIEVLLGVSDSEDQLNGSLIIINENGEIVKDFGDRNYFKDDLHKIHDGSYQLVLQTHRNTVTTEIYSLPGTLTLAQEELILKQKNASFPNPATTSINISNSVKGKRGSYNLEVLSTNGATVLKKSVQAGDQDYISLDISGLTPGVYFYQLDQTKGKFIKK